MTRYIGIRHRVKATAAGEARPTLVSVIEGKRERHYELETETDELDWILGQYPVSWRLATKGVDDSIVDEYTNGRRKHHLKWRKVKKNEDATELSLTHWVEEKTKNTPHILEIPETLDGFKAGDVVGMMLGGSGDRLAFALSRQADELKHDTAVFRIQPGVFKTRREGLKREKDLDHQTLAELVQSNIHLFLPTTRRDRDLIRLTEAWQNRVNAMKARIGAEQRLRSHMIGKIFCSEEGKYPEGEIEVLYEQARSNDRVIQALVTEEGARNKEIEKILANLPVYNELLLPIRGIGPMISARIIVAIGDIRRFETKEKLKAFLGVHVLRGGKFGDRSADKQFARRRHGEIANWHPDGRQALFLFTDQCNRNEKSEWGQKLREYKVKFRVKHPVVQCSACEVPWDECKKSKDKASDTNDKGVESKHTRRYGDGHIHKMASWRTATKFIEWLWKNWTKLEQSMSNPTEEKKVA